MKAAYEGSIFVGGKRIYPPKGLQFVAGAGLVRVQWQGRSVARIEKDNSRWVIYDRSGRAHGQEKRKAFAKAACVLEAHKALSQGRQPFEVAA